MSATSITGLNPRTGRGLGVTISDGLIASIEETPVNGETWLSPGFIDLQVNGYAGLDLNAETMSADTVTGLADAMFSIGVTCFLPTLITASEDSLCRRLGILAHVRRNHRRVAASVPFVHMEGPHISPIDGYRGAHPAEFVRPPDISEFERWQQAGEGIVGMVTLSPHFDGACDYIRALVERGVIVAIGHTHASPQQIRSAVDAGATLSTHLGNGIPQQIPRHTNPIWPQLADDRLTATFIADGHHLPQDALRAMLRAKGLGRSVLVSDVVALAGMPPGEYTTPVGGHVEIRPDGRLCVYGSQLLAGSAATLTQCIGRAVKNAGVALGDAIAMATEIPGRFAGGRGSLAVGARADLVRFRWDDEIVIQDVWLAGERL